MEKTEKTEITIAENQQKIQQKALAISKSIDPANPDSLSNFGVETQRKLGHYSNELLTKVKAKDSGEAGDAINELLNQINMIKIDEQEKGGFFSRPACLSVRSLTNRSSWRRSTTPFRLTWTMWL